jgi:predicted transcriptional regulator
MEVLWRKPDTALTGREVADALPTYAYTTVSTVLNRLSHKGLVRRGDDAPRIRYSATDTDAAYTAVTMHRLLLAATDPAETLAQFAQIASPRQAAVLRNALTTPMDTP